MVALGDIEIITREQLVSSGLTEDQIRNLERLRQYYPHIEFLDSRRQWHRLRLMKWMIMERKAPSN